MKGKEYLNSLLISKKRQEKKFKIYHSLFHKYRRKHIFSLLSFLFLIFFLVFFIKDLPIIFKLLFVSLGLVSGIFFIYFSLFLDVYKERLENCSRKITQLNEQIIEIIISSKNQE